MERLVDFHILGGEKTYRLLTYYPVPLPVGDHHKLARTWREDLRCHLQLKPEDVIAFEGVYEDSAGGVPVVMVRLCNYVVIRTYWEQEGPEGALEVGKKGDHILL